MAEEITRTIENVDRLFSEIVVNGESHVSQRFNAPSPQSSTPSVQEQAQGEDVHAVDLNNVLHNFSDPEMDAVVQDIRDGLAGEVSARSLADQALSSDIAIEANARQSADNLLQGSITAIENKIPAQASAQNQLADKNFVNSSIATNTANFLGTYTSMADIEAIPNPTNNDYVFLQTTDASGNNLFDRYKYNADQSEWLFEYELNNSSFTAEQWATINSGLTQSSVTQEIEDAINALDVAQVGGTGKYIESISQADGKITAVEKTFASIFLDIAHPVGSLYWTSSSENPAVTFGGGTWKQIKDVFVWAKGDSDTVDATGGSKTVTLTVDQLPSHNHSFTGTAVTSGANSRGHTHSVTASGTISVTTNPTFTGSSHSHTYTPAGTISVTTNPTFSGSAVASGGSKATITSVSEDGGWSAEFRGFSGSGTTDQVVWGISGCSYKQGTGSSSNRIQNASTSVKTGSLTAPAHSHTITQSNHTHSVTASGSISGGAYKFTGTQASLSATQGGTISGGAYKFTGSAVTSGAESQDHTHSVTASGTIGNKGGGGSHSNMPPYVVKYCWERTA